MICCCTMGIAQNATAIFDPQDLHTHSSSIVALPNGNILACWFQGSGERKANDVKIMGARWTKKTNSWSVPFLMADSPGMPDCNPVLFIDANNKLVLYWIVVQANEWETSILKYKSSTDYLGKGAPEWSWQDVILLKPDQLFEETIEASFNKMDRGLTWAAYANKYENMIVEAAKDKKKKETGWMTRCQPLILKSGRMLLPLYSDGFNLSIMAISDDAGSSWESSLPIVGYGNIQPSLVQKKDGSIIAYMRDNGDFPGRILESVSLDNGYSWSIPKKGKLLNPGTSVQVLKLSNGHWIMVYNDLEDGRHSLAISKSIDEGKTWTHTKHLENTAVKKGSFSYPSLIETSNHKIHISYSHSVNKKETIKHLVIKESWLDK